MQTLPLDSSSQHDPTAGSKIDGVTVTCCGDEMLVYGGWAADRVWRLDLATATWTEVICSGTIPPAREYHAATFYGGHLLVCGGEMMVSPKHGQPQFMNYYELSLDTYEWMAIECYGSVPVNRSHHTAVMCADSMVVFGGKPADGKAMTNGTLAESKRVGFYDVFVLHVISRTWKRVEMFDPKAPMLWGHTAVNFRDAYLLFFGGMDVSQNDFVGSPFVAGQSNSVDAPPIATLSDTVHVLHCESWHWTRCSVSEDRPGPVPRSMHMAHVHRVEMIVFGGFTVDALGRCINVNDCWVWNIESGEWRRMEFCVPQWNTKRLLSVIYYDQLVVAPQLSSLCYLDLVQKATGWQRIACKTSQRMVHGRNESPRIVSDASAGPVRSASSPHAGAHHQGDNNGREERRRAVAAAARRVPHTNGGTRGRADDGLIGPSSEKITTRKPPVPTRLSRAGRHDANPEIFQARERKSLSIADPPKKRPFEVSKSLPQGFLNRTQVYEAEVDVLKAEVERLRAQLREKERERSGSTRQNAASEQVERRSVASSAVVGANAGGPYGKDEVQFARWDDVASSVAYEHKRTEDAEIRAASQVPRGSHVRSLTPPANKSTPQQRRVHTPTSNRPVGPPRRIASPHRPTQDWRTSTAGSDHEEREEVNDPIPAQHPLGLPSAQSHRRNVFPSNGEARAGGGWEQQSSPKDLPEGRRHDESPDMYARNEFGVTKMPESLVQFSEVERKRREITELKRRKIEALQSRLDNLMQSNRMSAERAAAVRQIMDEVQRAKASLADAERDELLTKQQEREMIAALGDTSRARAQHVRPVASQGASLMATRRLQGSEIDSSPQLMAEQQTGKNVQSSLFNTTAAAGGPVLGEKTVATPSRAAETGFHDDSPERSNRGPPPPHPTTTAPGITGLDAYWQELDAALNQQPRPTAAVNLY